MAKQTASVTSKSKLTVLIPAYNAENYIGPTLTHLWNSLKNTKWRSIEILVIDDGSTDKTAEVAESTKTGAPIKVIRQKNAGRLQTRKNGLDIANGDFVFMLDSRVYTQPGAFEFMAENMNKDPKSKVWMGHIIMDRRGNPFARFWWTVTFIAWRRYMRRPRLMHYGIKDYDYYPKGTGCFMAPKQYLIDAYDNFQTYYKDNRFSNDDTALLRQIAARSDIYIAPEFAFFYNARSTFKAFIPHTIHRGIVFIDGFLKRGTRFFYPLIAYLIAVPLAIMLVIFKPILLLLIIPMVLAVFLFALVLGTPILDAAALAYVMPFFTVYYTWGLYKGLVKKFQNR